MIHLRIVAPRDHADRALSLLERTDSVVNVIVLREAARKPHGDVILCDVAAEDASVVISDLRHLEIDRCGSIAVEKIDTQLSQAAVDAEKAARGAPADAVVWEEVTSRTSEESTLSWSFALFVVLAMLIAAVGIFLNSSILVVGAMVVGPEFGPIAGFCVALVNRRPALAVRSGLALAVGFPAGITLTCLTTLAFKATDVIPDDFSAASHDLAQTIANPDFLSFFVAFCAGIAGMLSLTTAKSGALIGVLVSVTTIPAAANIGIAFAYGDWSTWRGSQQQLAINIGAIIAAGVLTLMAQRALYARRRRRHVAAMAAMGLDDSPPPAPATPSSPGTTTRRSSSARGR